MITNKCDILIEQGADWSFSFPVDPSIDLSAGSAAMMIRTACGSTYIATLTTANNGLALDATNQQINARITNGATSAFIPLDDYVYDIKFQGSDNIIYRTNEGNAIVDGQVTYIAPPSTSGIAIATQDGVVITTQDGQPIITS